MINNIKYSYCGCRRLVGVAHVEDFESIKDIELKAKCEIRAANFATKLLVDRNRFNTIEDLITLVKQF